MNLSMEKKLLIAVIISLCWTGVTTAEDTFGRLFFSPDQRSTLEELRHAKPVVVEIPEIIFSEPVIEEKKPDIGNIEINGLVYRKNGKSTAWINKTNSYEGNLANEYIQIDAENIKPEDVEIVMPVNDSKINLRAGDSYNPESGEINKLNYHSR
jgi:hypothetical protein